MSLIGESIFLATISRQGLFNLNPNWSKTFCMDYQFSAPYKFCEQIEVHFINVEYPQMQVLWDSMVLFMAHEVQVFHLDGITLLFKIVLRIIWWARSDLSLVCLSHSMSLTHCLYSVFMISLWGAFSTHILFWFHFN